MNSSTDQENLIQNLQPYGLILIRGLPGSGKSTLAQALLKELGAMYDGDVKAFEADSFFMKNGEYKFDATQLRSAHSICQRNTDMALDSGDYQYVIVSNTFTTLEEMQPYLNTANATDNLVTIINMTGNYGSIHNVPQDVINTMGARFAEINDPCDLINSAHSKISKVLSMS